MIESKISNQVLSIEVKEGGRETKIRLGKTSHRRKDEHEKRLRSKVWEDSNRWKGCLVIRLPTKSTKVSGEERRSINST